MASFHSVNYSLRPNKNIERKLIFEALQQLAHVLPLATYRYIGFGSMWFTDFALAHRVLGIVDMTSIERDVGHAARAQFNRPFACVKVVPGESSIVLPTADIGLGAKAAIVWLDYDTDLSGPAMDDMATVCERVAARSVVLVTVNAHKAQLSGTPTEAGQSRGPIDALRFLTKDRVALDFDANRDFTLKAFPRTVSTVLLDHFERCTRKSGRAERFMPLFNFGYSDGAPMVTVGGIIVNAADRASLEKLEPRDRLAFIQEEAQTLIEAPILTNREKQALDQLLPCAMAPTEDAVRERAGFPLSSTHIAQYHRYYRQYPIFTEFQP